MTDPVLVVEGLSKRFGAATAVRDLSFSVPRGEILGFLGPNGAGKTTTMRVIAGFTPPTEGRVLVGGDDVVEAPLAAKRRIGYLPETPPLYGEMDVIGYLEFAARLRGMRRSALADAVARAVERCALGDVRTQLIRTLSRGYRQRVGLAQAMVHEPEVLILDEPTAGLDPGQIHETRLLIRELAGERTVVLSTHILPEVAATCDRVVIVRRGRLVAEDAPGRLAARLGAGLIELETAPEAAPAVASILGRVPGVHRVLDPEPGPPDLRTGVVQVEPEEGADPRSALAKAVVDAGRPLLGMRRAGASLEDVYLELTTREPTAEKDVGDVGDVGDERADGEGREPS